MLWFGTLTLLVNSCDLLNKKDKVVAISPEFAVEISETLGESRELQFHLFSISSQPCLNYGIDASAWRFQNTINLKINDLISPSFCQEGNGPATSFISFGNLASGTYDLNISLKDIFSNTGELKVKEDELQIKLNTSDGIEMLYPVLKRIPVKSIWGYVGYNDKSASETHAQAFVTSLAKISQDSGLKSGFYGHFIVDKTATLIFRTPPPFQNFQTFKFYYDGHLSEIRKLIDHHINLSGEGKLKIKVFVWDGSVL